MLLRGVLLHACARKYVNNWSVIGKKTPLILFFYNKLMCILFFYVITKVNKMFWKQSVTLTCMCVSACSIHVCMYMCACMPVKRLWDEWCVLLREKFALLFGEPVALQAGCWYAAWAKVAGPSSDCGASGLPTVTSDDQWVTPRPAHTRNQGSYSEPKVLNVLEFYDFIWAPLNVLEFVLNVLENF